MKDTLNFSLNDYLKFTVHRGDEDSADFEDLSVNVTTKVIDNNRIDLSARFDKPAAVSIGSKPDILIIEVMNPEFFASRSTGSMIEDGHTWIMNLPKMYSNTQF